MKDEAEVLEADLRQMYHEVANSTPPLGPASHTRSRSHARESGVILAAVAAVAAAVFLPQMLGSVPDEHTQEATPAATQQTHHSLVGSWMAKSLKGAPVKPIFEGDKDPILELRTDGTFTALDSCISIEGEYVTDAARSTISFPHTQSRAVACGNHYPHPVTGTHRFELRSDGAVLAVLGKDGRELGTYSRVRS